MALTIAFVLLDHLFSATDRKNAIQMGIMVHFAFCLIDHAPVAMTRALQQYKSVTQTLETTLEFPITDCNYAFVIRRTPLGPQTSLSHRALKLHSSHSALNLHSSHRVRCSPSQPDAPPGTGGAARPTRRTSSGELGKHFLEVL
ncbi:hypothetical protein Lal_00030428, partial [Lupinus albus]